MKYATFSAAFTKVHANTVGPIVAPVTMSTMTATGRYSGIDSASASQRNGMPPRERFANRFQVACATAEARIRTSANAVTACA